MLSSPGAAGIRRSRRLLATTATELKAIMPPATEGLRAMP